MAILPPVRRTNKLSRATKWHRLERIDAHEEYHMAWIVVFDKAGDQGSGNGNSRPHTRRGDEE
jgi:hypothetical protein